MTYKDKGSHEASPPCMSMRRDCNTLQHTATYCIKLQRTAAHPTTPQHTCDSLFNCSIYMSSIYVSSIYVSSIYVSICRDCRTLHYTATYCNASAARELFYICVYSPRLRHTATHCNKLLHTATTCNTLQHTATHRDTPSAHYLIALYLCPFTDCKTLKHTATNCNTLQHTSAHRNTLQHTCS